MTTDEVTVRETGPLVVNDLGPDPWSTCHAVLAACRPPAHQIGPALGWLASVLAERHPTLVAEEDRVAARAGFSDIAGGLEYIARLGGEA